MTDGDGVRAGDETDAIDHSATDRRAMLWRLAAASAFSAPVVASFTMDGLSVKQNEAAAAVLPSPWQYLKSFRVAAGGASYAWIPRAAYLVQDTGSPTDPAWLSMIGPGATGVLVEFTVILSQNAVGVSYSLTVGGARGDSGFPGAGRYSKTVTFAQPTTAPTAVRISFGTITGPAVGIDDVVVRGLF